MKRYDARFTRISTLLASTALSGLASAGELPQGGSVAHGAVGISTPATGAMVIQQSSPSAIVNWQSFSIGQNARVDITQPSEAAALLNRVTGSTPSTIAGQLNANGQVYLVNPNGIAITPTGVVRAGAFVASTLGISDDDFKSGKRTFTGNGQSAAVVNEGTIDIGRGGYAALLGGRVDNSGTVSVPLGKVGFGAGEQATLDLSGDGFLQVTIPSNPSAADSGPLIRHSGRVTANGGRIEMRAATARDAARHAINLSGITEARSVSGRSGAIVLGGGEGGRVTVSGKLDTSARKTASNPKASKGGSITITGAEIALKGATVDASGATGGGTIRIGGDVQGKGTLARATTTTIDAASTIRADALEQGDGGSVVVWSDQYTSFEGLISARGGAEGGNGGFAEVSGKAVLSYTGLADLSAPKGTFGTLLLDPYNVIISDAPSTSGFTAGSNDSIINAGTLEAALNLANVTVTTGGAGSPGTQEGDITVVASVDWSERTTLTLSAFRDINLEPGGSMSVPAGGSVVLRADNSGTGTGTVNYISNQITLNSDARALVFYNPVSYDPNNQTNYLPLVSSSSGLTAFMLVNTLADLSNIRMDLFGDYALGRDIDASATAGSNGGAGFAPIGGSETPFFGIFTGLGHTISGLTINRPDQDNVGLFGYAAGTIHDVHLTNARIVGRSNVGALAGTLDASSESSFFLAEIPTFSFGTIINSSASALVSGVSRVGGLVGFANGGSIDQSHASGAVVGTSPSGFSIGGLVGTAAGTSISQTYSTAFVTGSSSTGGLVGSEDDASVTNSYWDVLTSGQSTSAGGIGVTTASLQAGLPSGFSSDTWGILPGLSYPYLLSRFPNGPLVVSGFVGGTPNPAAAPVGLAAGGSIRDTSYSGANGYYYVATDPLTGPAPQGVTAFLNFPTGFLLGSSTTDAPIGPGAVTGLDVLAGQSLVRTTQPTARGAVALLANTGDSRLSQNIPYTTGGSVFFSPGVNVAFLSLNPGGFILDDTIVANGNMLFTALGPLTITSGSLQSQTGDVVASVPQFLNFGGPDAIQAAGRFLLYSINPFLDVRGGLGGGTLFGRTFAGFPPGTIGEPGSQIIYATSFPVIPPNLDTEIPTSFNPVIDPPDIIDITLPGGGGGGPTLGIGLGTQEERSIRTLDFVERISSELERQVAECDREFEMNRANTQAYVTCVGNALETYADALDRRVVDLPQPLRGVSAFIREAARRVRASRTVSEARAAVRTAIREVHKVIALLRADEPTVARIQVRQGNRIEAALQSVENRLAKAVGL